MQAMQALLWRGMTDHTFESRLLQHTRDALNEFDLSPAEQSALADSPGHSLRDMAMRVEAWRRGEPASVSTRERAGAGYVRDAVRERGAASLIG